MNTEKLKIGLILDSYEVPAWIYASIQQIIASGLIDICIIFIKLDVVDASTSGLSIGERCCKLSYKVFNIIDEKIFLKGPNALKPVNLNPLLSKTPTILLNPKQLDISIFEQIKKIHLHIIIDFRLELSFEKLVNLSEYGTWLYVNNASNDNDGPLGLLEVVKGISVTKVALLSVKKDTQSTYILYEASFSTYALSPARNRNQILWSLVPFLSRQLILLYNVGETNFFKQKANWKNNVSLKPIQRICFPGCIVQLISLIKIARTYFYELVSRIFFVKQWLLLYSLSNDIQDLKTKFQYLIPPKDRFWADPMVIKKKDNYYIFIEEYIYKQRKGQISVIEMDINCKFSDPVCVLERDYHLSYPFVFHFNDDYYMVPESAGNNSIDLYRCVDFPYRWEFTQRLMENVNALDTTILYHAGKWWMFTATAEYIGAFPNVELFLYYSDELISSHWNPHPKNPISSDVKNSRPAGKIIVSDGKLIRPSQDCSKFYGYGFDLNEILTLSESNYAERRTVSVRPYWENHIIATHTYACEGQLTVIDGLRKKSKFS
jgi:hypothetical protein